MKRSEVMKQYDVYKSIIRSLGKFENEMLYAPHFWQAYLDGDGEDVNNVLFFVVSDEDRKEFSELKDVYGVTLQESENGFVHCESYFSKEKYDAALQDCQDEELNTEES